MSYGMGVAPGELRSQAGAGREVGCILKANKTVGISPRGIRLEWPNAEMAPES